MSVTIVGIHTGIGKSVCSAVICQALGYDYWKPVQAGDLAHSDSIFIKAIVSNRICRIRPEAYRLHNPISPHHAASLDGIEIDKSAFVLPAYSNNIVVETAGGILTPLAKNFLNIDLVAQLGLPVVLVSGNYLGSINHSLLTADALSKRNIRVIGIVFNGTENKISQNFILEYTKLPLLFSIPLFEQMDAATMAHFAGTISQNIFE